MVVHAANLLLLVLLLVGLPAATSQKVGPWNLSEPATLRGLTFAGLALGAALNALAWFAIPGNKTRRRCLRWFGAHLALMLLQFLVMKDIIDFTWLRRWLHWLQKKLSG